MRNRRKQGREDLQLTVYEDPEGEIVHVGLVENSTITEDNLELRAGGRLDRSRVLVAVLLNFLDGQPGAIHDDRGRESFRRRSCTTGVQSQRHGVERKISVRCTSVLTET